MGLSFDSFFFFLLCLWYWHVVGIAEPPIVKNFGVFDMTYLAVLLLGSRLLLQHEIEGILSHLFHVCVPGSPPR